MLEEHLVASTAVESAGFFLNLEEHYAHYQLSHLQMEAGSLAGIRM
jgi:hypothetical protein